MVSAGWYVKPSQDSVQPHPGSWGHPTGAAYPPLVSATLGQPTPERPHGSWLSSNSHEPLQGTTEASEEFFHILWGLNKCIWGRSCPLFSPDTSCQIPLAWAALLGPRTSIDWCRYPLLCSPYALKPQGNHGPLASSWKASNGPSCPPWVCHGAHCVSRDPGTGYCGRDPRTAPRSEAAGQALTKRPSHQNLNSSTG